MENTLSVLRESLRNYNPRSVSRGGSLPRKGDGCFLPRGTICYSCEVQVHSTSPVSKSSTRTNGNEEKAVLGVSRARLFLVSPPFAIKNSRSCCLLLD